MGRGRRAAASRPSVKVLIEEVEDVVGRTEESRGMIALSKRKAEKIEAWLKVMETVHENDIVTGVVTRKIKGGLLVDIGVNVFLPASQVDIRRPADIGDYIGRTIQCIVLKIDEARRNIVVSRRALIETERAEKKAKLLGRARSRARSARAWSRTSPSSARSSTWAASTACCTSPT